MYQIPWVTTSLLAFVVEERRDAIADQQLPVQCYVTVTVLKKTFAFDFDGSYCMMYVPSLPVTDLVCHNDSLYLVLYRACTMIFVGPTYRRSGPRSLEVTLVTEQ
jgi:hypothetical protein